MNKEEIKKMILQVLKEYQFGDNLKDGSYVTGIKRHEFGNVADDIVKNLTIPIVGRSVWIVHRHDSLVVYGCFDTEDNANKYVNNASNFIIKKLDIA